MDTWPLAELYGILGSSTTDEILRCDKQLLGPPSPPYTILAAPLIRLTQPSSTDIVIINLGGAFLASEPRHHWGAPIAYATPEAPLDPEVGQPAGMWAFACTIFALSDPTRILEAGGRDR